MLEEELNIDKNRPDVRPSGIALSLILRPIDQSPSSFLVHLREAWRTVASWGRWSDEQMGDWPETRELIAKLPDRFREQLADAPAFELENWMDALHDREWQWWSGAVVGERVKIDLSTDGMPISWWPIEFIAEKLGGRVEYRNGWRGSDEVPISE